MNEVEVKKIASLAKIKLTDEEIAKITPELSGILDWVKMLDEVDVSDVDSMVSVVGDKLPLRKDEVTDGNIQKDILKNANAKYNCFAVPKVVDSKN